jgi:hypothetical protein
MRDEGGVCDLPVRLIIRRTRLDLFPLFLLAHATESNHGRGSLAIEGYEMYTTTRTLHPTPPRTPTD